MNPWCPTVFFFYSVPQVQYQLSCLKCSYTNLMAFTCLWLTSSFMQSHSMLPTDIFPGNMLSLPKHRTKWFHSQIHTLTEFIIYPAFLSNFFFYILRLNNFQQFLLLVIFQRPSQRPIIQFLKMSIYHLFIQIFSVNSTRGS